MYAQSTPRRTLTAVVLIAALSGVISASIEPGAGISHAATQRPAVPQSVAAPMLPEVVVTADRLPG
jgi:hypothetical protein